MYSPAQAHVETEPTWRYWVDWFIWPPAAVETIALWPDRRNLWLVPLGMLAFSFLEYWVHRLPLHRWAYHATHEVHHRQPRLYVVFPPLYVPSGMTVALAACLLLGAPGLFAGFALGYVWFISWHHVLHHVDLWRPGWPAWVRRYAVWHLGHHHDEAVNFGITLPVWDYLFGTRGR